MVDNFLKQFDKEKEKLIASCNQAVKKHATEFKKILDDNQMAPTPETTEFSKGGFQKSHKITTSHGQQRIDKFAGIKVSIEKGEEELLIQNVAPYASLVLEEGWHNPTFQEIEIAPGVVLWPRVDHAAYKTYDNAMFAFKEFGIDKKIQTWFKNIKVSKR